jgi:hypothetical protein
VVSLVSHFTDVNLMLEVASYKLPQSKWSVLSGAASGEVFQGENNIKSSQIKSSYWSPNAKEFACMRRDQRKQHKTQRRGFIKFSEHLAFLRTAAIGLIPYFQELKPFLLIRISRG